MELITKELNKVIKTLAENGHIITDDICCSEASFGELKAQIKDLRADNHKMAEDLFYSNIDRNNAQEMRDNLQSQVNELRKQLNNLMPNYPFRPSMPESEALKNSTITENNIPGYNKKTADPAPNETKNSQPKEEKKTEAGSEKGDGCECFTCEMRRIGYFSEGIFSDKKTKETSEAAEAIAKSLKEAFGEKVSIFRIQ